LEQRVQLFKPHCIAGAPGAHLVRELDSTAIRKVFRKGTDAGTECFSGFYDMHGKSTGLIEWLDGQGAKGVDIVGVATEYCVRATAVHAVTSGFDTTVIQDAVAAVGDVAVTAALRELRALGVRLQTADEYQASLTLVT
jgi:nicotinamidase/pyrazinamidase